MYLCMYFILTGGRSPQPVDARLGLQERRHPKLNRVPGCDRAVGREGEADVWRGDAGR